MQKTPVPDLEYRIVHEEGGVVVVDKPALLPSTGRKLDDRRCLQWAMIERNHGDMVWAVHQLDTGTSGLNVFVTKKSLVPVWQERLRAATARKRYLGIIHGRLPKAQVTVDEPIGWTGAPPNRRWGIARKGKHARSHFQELGASSDGSSSVISVRIETGRTHQIRVHLEHLGLALVGEPYYCSPPCEALPRVALHAWKLRFTDGVAPDRFEAAVPEDLRALALACGADAAVLGDAPG